MVRLIDVSTHEDNLRDAQRFTEAYAEPIRCAVASLRFVPPDLIDDIAQDFLAKQLARRVYLNRHPINKTFRDYIFRAIRNHAIDMLRQVATSERRQAAIPLEEIDAQDPRPAEASSPEADALYALTYLTVALRLARRHYEEIGEGDKWEIFDALVLGPADPSTPRPTREQLRAKYGARGPKYLDQCATTVKRSIRSVLPLLLPRDLSDRASEADRLAEWKDIFRTCRVAELGWLRWVIPSGCEFTTMGGPSLIPSQNLAVSPSPGVVPLFDDEATSEELPDEQQRTRMRFTQSVWLAMPFGLYLDAGPEDRPAGQRGRGAAAVVDTDDTLRSLLDEVARGGIPRGTEAFVARMRQLKGYGKRVYGAAGRRGPADVPPPPAAFGQLVYTLASALAVTAAGTRVDTLPDAALAGNVAWALEQPWLDGRFRTALESARSHLAGA